jgi:hypothetical protein
LDAFEKWTSNSKCCGEMKKQTDRKTDRQTERQTHRQTDRQTDRKTDRQTVDEDTIKEKTVISVFSF